MAVYQVLKLPDKTLRARSLAVKKINDGVWRVLDNMRDTLYAEDGLGLAAPQIGVLKRIIIVNTKEQYIELINPEIIEKTGEQIGVEGCLSVPGILGRVERAAQVKVKGLNRRGEEVVVSGDELLARALQHEIDHLDGILFIDKAIETRKE